MKYLNEATEAWDEERRATKNCLFEVHYLNIFPMGPACLFRCYWLTHWQRLKDPHNHETKFLRQHFKPKSVKKDCQTSSFPWMLHLILYNILREASQTPLIGSSPIYLIGSKLSFDIATEYKLIIICHGNSFMFW